MTLDEVFLNKETIAKDIQEASGTCSRCCVAPACQGPAGAVSTPPPLMQGASVCSCSTQRQRLLARSSCLQELTKSMSAFGFTILAALVNDIAPAHKVKDAMNE